MLVDVKNERVDSSLGTRSEQRPSLFCFSSRPLLPFFFLFCFIPRFYILPSHDRDSFDRGGVTSKSKTRSYVSKRRARKREIVSLEVAATRSGGKRQRRRRRRRGRRLKNFSNSTSLTDRWDTFLPETSHRFDRVLRPFPPGLCVCPACSLPGQSMLLKQFFRQDYSVNSMDVCCKDRTTDWKLFWNGRDYHLSWGSRHFFFPFSVSLHRFFLRPRANSFLATTRYCRLMSTFNYETMLEKLENRRPRFVQRLYILL